MKHKDYIGKALEDARDELKENLARCSDAQRLFFKRMYAHGNLEMSIDDVIDGINEEELDWAMQQVEGTLRKIYGDSLGR